MVNTLGFALRTIAAAAALSVLLGSSAQAAETDKPAVAAHRDWDDDRDWDHDRDWDDHDRGSRDGGWGDGRRGRWTDLIGFAANNGGSGFWVLAKDGQVHAFNGAPDIKPRPTLRTPVAITSHPTRSGYWLVDKRGLVTAHGAVRNYGRVHLGAAVGIAAHRSGRGYWVVGKSGAVRVRGMARHVGQLSLRRVHVDRIVARDDADGYYLHTTADVWRAFPRFTPRTRPDPKPPRKPQPVAPRPDPTPPRTGPVRTTVVYGITVATSISTKVRALMAKADRDGVSLGGWGYRSTARQIELRRQHCGRTRYAIWRMPSSRCSPPTARPGTSMHEKGLAIDFYKKGRNGAALSIGGTREFRWLKSNARRFGLYNLPSEPWHWSTNGH